MKNMVDITRYLRPGQNEFRVCHDPPLSKKVIYYAGVVKRERRGEERKEKA